MSLILTCERCGEECEDELCDDCREADEIAESDRQDYYEMRGWTRGAM